MAWIASDRMLWAGDYVQDLRAPTQYAREVIDAVARAGLHPRRFAAEHLSLATWSQLESLFAAAGTAPGVTR